MTYNPVSDGPVVKGPGSIIAFLRNVVFKDTPRPFRRVGKAVVLLDGKMRIAGHILAGVEETRVEDAIWEAQETDSALAGVVLVHFHPHGSPLPSQDEIADAAQLRNALRQNGLSLTDVVIIGSRKGFSFADEAEFGLNSRGQAR